MRNVLIIAGPPCSGKTTLAQRLAVPGDLIADRDLIAYSLGYGLAYGRNKAAAHHAEQLYHRMLDQIAAADTVTAYVVRCLPYSTQRARIRRRLDAQVQLLDPGIDVCLARAEANRRPPITATWIRQWYASYTPDPPTRQVERTPIVCDVQNI